MTKHACNAYWCDGATFNFLTVEIWKNRNALYNWFTTGNTLISVTLVLKTTVCATLESWERCWCEIIPSKSIKTTFWETHYTTNAVQNYDKACNACWYDYATINFLTVGTRKPLNAFYDWLATGNTVISVTLILIVNCLRSLGKPRKMLVCNHS